MKTGISTTKTTISVRIDFELLSCFYHLKFYMILLVYICILPLSNINRVVYSAHLMDCFYKFLLLIL